MSEVPCQDHKEASSHCCSCYCWCHDEEKLEAFASSQREEGAQDDGLEESEKVDDDDD